MGNFCNTLHYTNQLILLMKTFVKKWFRADKLIYSALILGFLVILSLPFFVLPFYRWLNFLTWSKAIVFRIVFSVLLFISVFYLLFRSSNLLKIHQRISAVAAPLILLVFFLLLSFLSVISSVDPNFSLWGDPFRVGGFVNTLSYSVFAVMLFLAVKRNDWEKVWFFVFFVGILVSFTAFFQRFGIFSNFLLSYPDRPISTIGNPILLAIFLLFLVFMSFVFGIKSGRLWLKIFYFFSFFIFLFSLFFLTQSRAAILGLIIGFFWILFASAKIPIRLKVFSVIFIIFLIIIGIYIDSRPEILKDQPFIIRSAIGRALSVISEPDKILESRISIWKVAISTIKERPFFGWGPENFSVGFDRYYNPSLPRIGPAAPPLETDWVQWWDRAHNFAINMAVENGLIALIFYLSFFSAIVYYLQKVKKNNPEWDIVITGVQASLIGYFTADFFSIDSFDTYILLFLLVGYSFFIIAENKKTKDSRSAGIYPTLIFREVKKYRFIILAWLFVVLSWFIHEYNLKTIKITNDLNSIYIHASDKNIKKTQEAIFKLSSERSTIDNYISIKIAEIIKEHILPLIGTDAKQMLFFSQKELEILRSAVGENPNHIKNLIYAGENVNFVIKLRAILNDNFTKTSECAALKAEADYYFGRAEELSPNRQQVYGEWAKTGLAAKDYELAKEKALKCIGFNPNYGDCYFTLALLNGYLKNRGSFKYYLELANERNFDTESVESLIRLIDMHKEVGDFKMEKETILKLRAIDSSAGSVFAI